MHTVRTDLHTVLYYIAESLKTTGHLGNLVIDERIILKVHVVKVWCDDVD